MEKQIDYITLKNGVSIILNYDSFELEEKEALEWYIKELTLQAKEENWDEDWVKGIRLNPVAWQEIDDILLDWSETYRSFNSMKIVFEVVRI